MAFSTDLETLEELSLCDLSALPKIGVKGPGAASFQCDLVTGALPGGGIGPCADHVIVITGGVVVTGVVTIGFTALRRRHR